MPPEVVVNVRLFPVVRTLLVALAASAALAAPPATAAPNPSATASAIAPARLATATIERERILMGTRCALVLQGDDADALDAAATAAFETIARLEQVASNWREDSELARFNAAATKARAVAASPDLYDVLARATAWAKRTDGAFDATVEPLTRAYDLRGGGRVPSEAERAQAARLARGAEVAVDPATRTLTLPAEGMAFDLGGIAKGWAIDRAVETLRARGVTRALVNFGGQVYALGAPVGADAWTVEIASPLERGKGVVTLQLKDRSLSTSAASERSVTVGGTTINHILDARTGRPAPAWGSASVIAASATDADCASTALYVLGADAGLAWAKDQPDLEAVMLTPDAAAPGGVRVERAGGPVAVLFPAGAALAAQGDGSGGAAPSNQELARRLDVLAGEVDDLKVGDGASSTAGDSHSGLGPAASKVYHVRRGVSLGGYGEMLYESFKDETDGGIPSGARARLDFVRAVTYIGYRFSDWALFNSEIEFEHGSTELAGSVSVEFAYLDFLAQPSFNVRAGMLLVPMGFMNELHEPPTYLTSRRPEVERNIVPSTWRANGAGLYGEIGPGLSYRAYVTESLRGVADEDAGIEGITAASGPYEARQNGSASLFSDVGLTGRLEWLGGGTRVGISAFTGGTAQGATDLLGDPFTARATIVEGHAEYKNNGIWVRALGARGTVDDAVELNEANGYVGDESVGSENYGAYVNVSVDVMRLLAKGSSLALWPFVQYERYNTQHEVPAGFAKNPSNDRKSWTMGAAFYPDPQIVVKADFQNKWTANGSAVDRFGVSLGYLF
jgi:thiamine biosynthesis lipoprotein ApbE